MRILFLQENGYYESIGVMYLAAFLKRAGHSVDLYVASEERNLFDKIRKFSPDLIAISCTTDMHTWVLSIARKCKKVVPAKIIVGGPHPTCFPELIRNREIDIVCQGEGEYPLVEYANRFDRGGNLTDIPGLWVKKGRKIIPNSPDNLIQDFTGFPVPDRSLYYKYGFIRNMPMKRFITGRGCPFQCAFCHNQLLKGIFISKGMYVRKMPVDKIIAEIQDVRKKYPMTTIHFSDDTFVLNRAWVTEFCTIYKKKIRLPFSCNVRADLLNEPLVKLLHKAGCVAVSFGVESGNERIRNMVLHKNILNKTIINAAKLLRKYNIKFLTTNMVGVPGETRDDVYDTILFNRTIRANFTRCFVFDAFPGLPLTNEAIRLGILPKNYSLKHFSALSHEPIIKNIPASLLRNTCSMFSVIVRPEIPFGIVVRLVQLPFYKITYTVGRLLQAYEEMCFFRVPLLPGLRYAWHSLRSFNAN